jgi:hypothetical protein
MGLYVMAIFRFVSLSKDMLIYKGKFFFIIDLVSIINQRHSKTLTS